MEVTTASTSVTATCINITTASAPFTTVGVSVNTAEPITTASEVVTIVEPSTPPTTTITVFEDEDLIIAQTLVKMRSEKSKAKEQEELTIEERSKLFVELMDKRKKHFARLRAEDKRRKPPTKAQKRKQMCTYLKHMAGFTHN
ncbi:hypothetical protein Tco_1096668 [Tanacetum coccineum]